MQYVLCHRQRGERAADRRVASQTGRQERGARTTTRKRVDGADIVTGRRGEEVGRVTGADSAKAAWIRPCLDDRLAGGRTEGPDVVPLSLVSGEARDQA